MGFPLDEGAERLCRSAPVTASATCLLADLVPLARVRAISHTEDGCELLLVSQADVLPQVADVVAEWLKLCSIHSAELWADGRLFALSAEPDIRAA